MNRSRIVKHAIATLVVLGIAGGVAYGVYRTRGVEASTGGATALARKSDFLVVVRSRGALKARNSVQVIAPVNVPELRIVWLADNGTHVKQGEPLIRFDPSSVKQQLQEKQATLAKAQASLDQAVAQRGIQTEQDKLDLTGAQADLERAELEVSKQEIVSKLKGEESRVDLEIANKKVSVQKSTVNLNTASATAQIASLTRARDKAKDEVELMEYRLSQMELRAPAGGMFHLMPNYSQGWMNARPFKVGDQAWPGGMLAEIPALESLEMEAKLSEIDRGRMKTGMPIRVRIDALPELAASGTLSFVTPMTVMEWEWPPSRNFRGYGQLEKIDGRLRPGMNGSMDVVIDRIPNAISIPAKALFTRNGKAVVYVVEQGKTRPLEVQILARNPDEIAIKGLSEGAQIALVEPETPKAGKS